MRDFLIVLLAILAKTSIVLSIKPAIISDSWEYVCYAKSLVQYGEYKCLYMADNPMYKNREFFFYRPPGYPIVIAGFMALLGSYWIVGIQIAQAVLEIFSLWLGLKTFRSTGVKVLWTLLLVVNSFWTPLILTESIFSSLLFIAVMFRTKPSSGLLLVVSTLIRQTGVLLAPILWRNWTAFGVLVLLLSVWSGFWMYRNFETCGVLTARTTNFYRHWASDLGIDVRRIASQVENKRCWEFEFDQKVRDAILSKVRENPTILITIYFDRLFDFFKLEPPFEISVTLLRFSEMPIFVKNLLTIFFNIFYGAVLFSCFVIIIELIILRRVSATSFAVLTFVVLHPFLSPSNLRFLHAVSLIALLHSLKLADRVACALKNKIC